MANVDEPISEGTDLEAPPPGPLPARGGSLVGRLRRMGVRDVWQMEEYDLTPWLAENLDVLEEQLDLRLELVESEHRVGRYELDLLLKSVDDDRVVIVENQFGRSDHDHLGKLLAYAAGTTADVVVWLSESFTEEHLAALQWLNESTAEGVGFFAVTLAAVKIGDSIPAPIVETVVRPNEWVKQTVRQRSNARREPRQQWEWGKYATELSVPEHRIEVGKELVEAIGVALSERGISFQQNFRKGYVGFKVTGGRNLILVDVYWNKAPRVAVKIPSSPPELGLISPFPGLVESWGPNEKEWGWTVPSLSSLPDVGVAIDLALQFHEVERHDQQSEGFS